ncbi:non-canonical purine NTP pyrophosphatase [bacterium BMS3Bbin05]|nr:non-canonical purine NTP pyrophosphatase [bacterium BMS3Bbin05]
MRIILATKNRGKIKEINAVLSGTGIEFAGLDLYPDMKDVVEDGITFHENAFKKARAVFDHTGIKCVSEDSGLEVDALNGAPGIYSSRFASENASDSENIGKLINDLTGVPYEKRTARFVSVFCLYDGREARYFEGSVRGHIIDSPRGTSGFGYDPLFVPDGYEKTFAELGSEVKNKISHRAKAISGLKEFLEKDQR